MIRILIAAVFMVVVFSSCSHSYYIVRHAEKATADNKNMSSDVPLTEQGNERAEALKDVLRKEKIAFVFSTNTIRTKSTAQPTASLFQLPVTIYGPRPDSVFISLLTSVKKNTLIVGHSNTVDDVVNMLCKEKRIVADLPETQYDNLFIVKKKGKNFILQQKKYGRPSE
ncbi:MAG: histidine phosphatase family protein [Chitinophagaceae bacterium]|nr:histidine phosphatase family protein [Chitinophagaceae bacterium]